MVDLPLHHLVDRRASASRDSSTAPSCAADAASCAAARADCAARARGWRGTRPCAGRRRAATRALSPVAVTSFQSAMTPSTPPRSVAKRREHVAEVGLGARCCRRRAAAVTLVARRAVRPVCITACSCVAKLPHFREVRRARAFPCTCAAADSSRDTRRWQESNDEVGTAQHRGRNRRLREQARERRRARPLTPGLQAAELELRGDARQQLARAERLDEVVVGAGLPAPRCAPPRRRAPRAGSRDVRSVADRRAARAAAPKPSRPGIITSVSTRSGGAARAAASAAAPSAAASTS